MSPKWSLRGMRRDHMETRPGRFRSAFHRYQIRATRRNEKAAIALKNAKFGSRQPPGILAGASAADFPDQKAGHGDRPFALR